MDKDQKYDSSKHISYIYLRYILILFCHTRLRSQATSYLQAYRLKPYASLACYMPRQMKVPRSLHDPLSSSSVFGPLFSDTLSTDRTRCNYWVGYI